MKNILAKKIESTLATLGVLLALSACQTMGTSDPIALEIQSRTALHAGEIDRALKLTQTLIAKQGPTPTSLNQMALLKLRKGDPEATGRILRYAHELYPTSTAITVNLAKFEASRGEMSTARATLLPLLSLKAWPEGFRMLMGRVDMETGHLPEASILLHEALRRHPDSPLVLANMGLLHERLGETRMAHRDLIKAKERAPKGALRQRIVALLHSIGP
ncbi:MAG: tetratricopeptide repeat protein [Leptospirillia bacterium]